jgi:ParB-like chromosome segregation protein Spo0J
MASKLKSVGGVKADNAFKALLPLFHIEDGFNVRDITKPSTAAKIEAMAECYRHGYSMPPIDAYLVGNTKLVVVDGHCRVTAARLAQSRGWVPDDFRLPFTEFKGNEADRIAHMVRSGQDTDPLTALEVADGYRRFRGQGFTTTEIAKRVGKSPTHIENLLLLIDAPIAIQTMVRDGSLAATTAIDAMKQHGPAAVAILTEAGAFASLAGKTKVTPKHVRAATPTPSSSSPTDHEAPSSRPTAKATAGLFDTAALATAADITPPPRPVLPTTNVVPLRPSAALPNTPDPVVVHTTVDLPPEVEAALHALREAVKGQAGATNLATARAVVIQGPVIATLLAFLPPNAEAQPIHLLAE